jgi:hypothetical protein
MRPQQLDDLLGQNDLVSVLKNKLQSGRLPHFFIFSGDIGCGKTTLARIVAALLQMPRQQGNKCPTTVHPEIWAKYDSLDIVEINAADKNGVDDVRELIRTMRYKPMMGSRTKVLILDEAHQLSAAAQNALLKDTEEPPEHAFFIFCTSQKKKIIAALLRRAEEFDVSSMDPKGVRELIDQASANASNVHGPQNNEQFIQCLLDNGVTAPGLVLKACERYFAGASIQASVFQTSESAFDTFALCRAVSSGSWQRVAPLLATMTKNDAIGARCMLLGFLKTNLLRSTPDKMVKYMNAIREVSRAPYDDLSVLPATIEAIARACLIISNQI